MPTLRTPRFGIAIAPLLLYLASCGGGGSDTPTPTPQATSSPPLALPAERISANTPVSAACTGGSSTGSFYANAEVEPFAAVHPSNANQWIAAWQQDRWSNGGARALVAAVTLDGGATWKRTLLPFSRCGGAGTGSIGDYERVSDPWVDIGPSGVMYAMGLSFTGGIFAPGASSALLASRSIDGGQTWSTPATLLRDGEALFNDKNSLTADPTDARYVYAIWDRLDPTNFGPTLMARSSDSGATWEPARVIYAPAVPAGSIGVSQTIGNRIVVLKDGTVLNLFTQIDTVGTRASTWLGMLRSNDKGLTWSAPLRIADVQAVGAKDPQTGKAIRDGATLASIAVGAGNDVWVSWQDARTSGGQRDAILLSRSQDGGLTWSAPQRINTQTNVAAFTPSVAVNADGVVGISHYDLRPDKSDSSTLLVGAWLLTSRDGSTWAETPIWSPFDLAKAPDARGLFLGDYQGLITTGTTFVPVLALSGTDTDNRTDIYALRVTPAAAARTQALAMRTPAAASTTPPSATQPEAGFGPAAFARARHEAIAATMDRRVPGWSSRMGRDAPSKVQP